MATRRRPLRYGEERVHQPGAPAQTHTVMRVRNRTSLFVPRRNPVVQGRGLGEKQGVTEVPSWDVVGEHVVGYDGPVGYCVDVRPRAENVRDTAGEITVHIAEHHKYGINLGTGSFADEVGSEVSERNRLREDALANIEWTKENATVVIRGESDDWRLTLLEFFDYAHTQSAEMRDREPLEYRQWHHMNAEVPVVIHENLAEDVTDLNTACLSPATREVYEEILGQARAQKEYQETNEDAFSSYPESFGGASRRHGSAGAAGALLDFNFIQVSEGTRNLEWKYLHENSNGEPTGAQNKFRTLLRTIKNAPDQPGESGLAAAMAKTFVKQLQWVCKHDFKMWSRAENGRGQPRGYDTNKDLVFMTAETADQVEDQLDDDMVDRINALTNEELGDLGRACGRGHPEVNIDLRVGVEYGAMIGIGDVEAHWTFTIDVDDLIEHMRDEFPDELGEDSPLD